MKKKKRIKELGPDRPYFQFVCAPPPPPQIFLAPAATASDTLTLQILLIIYIIFRLSESWSLVFVWLQWFGSAWYFRYLWSVHQNHLQQPQRWDIGEIFCLHPYCYQRLQATKHGIKACSKHWPYRPEPAVWVQFSLLPSLYWSSMIWRKINPKSCDFSD